MKSFSLSSIVLSLVAIIMAIFLFSPSLSFMDPVSAGDMLKASAEDPFGTKDTKIDAASDDTDLATGLINMINRVLTFLGVLLMFIVIYAGFLIITSNGEDDAITKGRKMIIYALIGVIVIVLSYTIVNFIGNIGTDLPNGDTK